MKLYQIQNAHNCSTCVYRHQAPKDAHCYMFKYEPPKCTQWRLDLIPPQSLVQASNQNGAR